MERAVLANEGIAGHAHRFAGGIGLNDSLASQFVGFGTVVSGIKHRLIHHEIIGIGGRQAVALFIIDSRGHRHGYQPVRLAFGRSESLDLLFHALQSGIMLVVLVGAFHIKDRVVGAKAG